MRLREADRFSDTPWRLLIVDWKRFWIAPSVLRSVLTEVSAASTLWIVELAPETLNTSWAFSEPARAADALPVAVAPAPASVRASPDESTRWCVESIDAYTPATLLLMKSANSCSVLYVPAAF